MGIVRAEDSRVFGQFLANNNNSREESPNPKMTRGHNSIMVEESGQIGAGRRTTGAPSAV